MPDYLRLIFNDAKMLIKLYDNAALTIRVALRGYYRKKLARTGLRITTTTMMVPETLLFFQNNKKPQSNKKSPKHLFELIPINIPAYMSMRRVNNRADVKRDYFRRFFFFELLMKRAT